MSGATSAYNLRKNKHVERQLFVELLGQFARWHSLREYLYVGFGGLYFEDFKNLHLAFGVKRMLSYERETWMLPRQAHNIPYGYIKAIEGTSGDLIQQLDAKRQEENADNVLLWLDYVTANELATQLSELRAVTPKLVHGDIVKVTLSCHSKWLNKGQDQNEIINRHENLKEILGSQYLPDGLKPTDMTNARLPHVYLGCLRKQLALALAEVPTLEFLPMGCYLYNDGTPMLTVTGAIINSTEQKSFLQSTSLTSLPYASPEWQLHMIDVPDLSLRERLDIDSKLGDITAEELAAKLSYKLDEEESDSVRLLHNYMRFYRYYPNYHRVQI